MTGAGGAGDYGRPRRGLKLLLSAVTVCLAGLLVPEQASIPVRGASVHDWNAQSFWYEPWGRSGVHKGIDIFAAKGTPLLAATAGIVVFQGEIALGGRVLAVLGPKWRVHYYAHLDAASVNFGSVVGRGQLIGAVGDSGNAAGKPPHLHYSVLTLVPYPWRWDSSSQGWKKMFYLDPGRMLTD